MDEKQDKTIEKINCFIRSAVSDLGTDPVEWAVPTSDPPRRGMLISKPIAMEAYVKQAVGLLTEVLEQILDGSRTPPADEASSGSEPDGSDLLWRPDIWPQPESDSDSTEADDA